VGHPANRAERRHERLCAIAKHRSSLEQVPNSSWRIQHRTNPILPGYGNTPPAWGKYAKWNLSCGSLLCHADKHFGARRKRREALKHAGQDDLYEWGAPDPDLSEVESRSVFESPGPRPQATFRTGT
jgi:hypothetical protein